MKVTVILPAHNEERTINDTINSLRQQSYDGQIEIIAVLDNCTDSTEDICKSHGDNVMIFKTINNRHKKAGALNQVFTESIKTMGNYILTMDADTIVHKEAIENGVKFLLSNGDHGAVCSKAGILDDKDRNLLWHLQNVEYAAFDSERIETNKNIKVAHGMFTLYRKSSIIDVINQRGTLFDLTSITEDYELTLMLKKLGYKISSNVNMKAWTEVPLKLKELWIQRVRWLTGGVDALFKHGWAKYTKRDILSHLLFIFIFIIQLYLLIASIIQKGNIANIKIIIFILLLSFIDAVLRLKYLSHKYLKTYLMVFLIAPFIIYAWFNIATLIVSYVTYIKLRITKTNMNW